MLTYNKHITYTAADLVTLQHHIKWN